MSESGIKLNENYQKSVWAVLFISAMLLIAYVYDAELNIPYLPVAIQNPKDTFKITLALLGAAVIYQTIQWHLCPTQIKRNYRALAIHFGSIVFALIVFYINYPLLVANTSLDGISIWWFFPFFLLGLIVGTFVAIISLASLLIRTREEADRLGLPRIPNVVLAQYRFGIPIAVVILLIYFIWQSYAPYETKAIGTLLFEIGFLKEVGQEIVRYYLKQDENGNRLSFQESIKGMREAINNHDYSYHLSSLSEFVKAAIAYEEKDSPADLQQKFQQRFSHRFNQEALEFKGAFFEAMKDGERDKARWPSLNDLVMSGQVDLLRQALDQKNVDFNQAETGGWTPLLCAAAQGYTAIMKLLLDNAADPNIGNIKKITPLHYGVRYNNVQICKLLLDYGANPNLQDDGGYTPLMMAAQLGNLSQVKNLLAHGADVYLLNHDGLSALDLAQLYKQGQIAKLLRKHIKA